MYTDYYKLKELPFNLSPSSRFLYLGEVHKEALAILTYGVVERKGFILLTGEIGTGKTTMVRSLIENLEENSHYVYLSNPLITPSEFFDYIAFSAFKKKVHFKSKADFLITFEEFLSDLLRRQENFILIIDEAQNLSFELLEEIRLLSNMETADEKLINIFLVGQPELNDKLNQPQCKALLQRISIRYHLKPLDLEAAREYIATRFRIAGAEKSGKIFPKNVIEAIYKYSQGYPRMINVLGDNALLLGYSRGKRRITPAMVKECYQDIRPVTAEPKEIPAQPVQSEARKQITIFLDRYWKWAIPLLVFFIASILIPRTVENDRERKVPSLGVSSREEEVKLVPGHIEKEKPIKNAQEEAIDTVELKAETDTGEIEETEEKTDNSIQENDTNIASENISLQPDLNFQEAAVKSYKTVIVKKGDNLTELAIQVYGWTDEGIINLLKKNNPDLLDVNLIEIGQEIVFPPLAKSEQVPTYTVHIASFRPFQKARSLFQELMNKGCEVYILPVNDPKKGKIFRVALGNFNDRRKALDYASEVRRTGLSDFAMVMKVEMQ